MRIGQDPRLEGGRQSKISEARTKARYALMAKLATDKIELPTYLDVMGRTHLISSTQGHPKVEKKRIEALASQHKKNLKKLEMEEQKKAKQSYKPVNTNFKAYLTGEPKYKKKKIDEPISKQKGAPTIQAKDTNHDEGNIKNCNVWKFIHIYLKLPISSFQQKC